MMHLFKFTQAQAKHLSAEEFAHYSNLGLIRGVGPHMTGIVTDYAEQLAEKQKEIDGMISDAEMKDANDETECPECGATFTS